LLGAIGQRHADKLNLALSSEMSGSREVFLPLTPRQVEAQRPMGSSVTYQPWAAAIAQVTAPLLPTTEPVAELSADTQTFKWVGAARALGRDGSNTPARIAELEEKARETFGMQVAQVTILDSDRQWFPNYSGPAPSSAPRHLTYCHVASQQTDLLIVPNANKDERFKDNAYLEQMHMPFYAGKALVDRSGEVIGSFCVLDSVPRPAWWKVNRDKLEQFAQQAQDELWRIEDEALAAAKPVVAEDAKVEV
jgi:GAF domain-containing protein